MAYIWDTTESEFIESHGEPTKFKTPSPDPKDFMQLEDYALIS
jgi:hypothetical protein